MERINDPPSEEALALLHRLGCSYRLIPFFPGPNVPPSTYPLEVYPPKGFHFDSGQHSSFLRDWDAVVDKLLGSRIVACDERCPR